MTLAKAAELAGLDIYDFMSACKQNEVAVIDISKEELLEELTSANRAIGYLSKS